MPRMATKGNIVAIASTEGASSLLITGIDEAPGTYLEKLNSNPLNLHPYVLVYSQETDDLAATLKKLYATLDEQGCRVASDKLFFNISLENLRSHLATKELSEQRMLEFADPKNPTQFHEILPRDYLDLTENALCDFYVYLPARKKYLPFLLSGLCFDNEKREKLRRHDDPRIFITDEDLRQLSFTTEEEVSAAGKLGGQVDKKIHSLQKALLNPRLVKPELILDELVKYSEEIIAEIASTEISSREVLDSFFKDIFAQNDIKCMTSIAVMLAKASGFVSKQAFKDLGQACLLMDLSLSSISPHIMNRYYSKHLPDSDDVKRKFISHPIKSEEIVRARFPAVNETVRKLILLHHEKFDGSGSPKSLKGSSIFPLAQVLSLAVEVFEELKCKDLKKGTFSFSLMFEGLQQAMKQGESRRHSPQMIERIIVHFGLADSKKKAA